MDFIECPPDALLMNFVLIVEVFNLLLECFTDHFGELLPIDENQYGADYFRQKQNTNNDGELE